MEGAFHDLCIFSILVKKVHLHRLAVLLLLLNKESQLIGSCKTANIYQVTTCKRNYVLTSQRK